MMPMLGLDWTMIILFPAILLAMWAQARVKNAFATYSRVHSRSGLTAREAARQILDSYGLSGVPIRQVGGQLTDHYDPRDRSLSLSEPVYDSTSIAAIGVAAHEVGHAVQHATGYAPLQIRNAVVPLLSLSSSAAMPLFFIGLLSASNMLMNIGILLFVGVLAFHLITLPVEFDASNRALKVLSTNGMMTRDEVGGARKVLNAAAMTYVSATLMAALQLVRLLALRNSRSRD
ncbi:MULTISPECIES: zinc metallopeptidase [unclassified Pyramidobacter]|uniref:zinc metallopeptidase n=1 Tax=unclassified Pyramidobacter TaxID=2632171 RepID=UPI00098E92B7|nr:MULTISPECIES: zinc metallopeptidase [unclassified Pyramidobacter]OON89850.1 zinc metallopeptidase [Pyramidobacter sp. C12-8]RKJ77370.1 zinc metallopeptidase [Pyramidobacter sp. CG50-2]WOL40259.1 zinc metallopeptidase [Pyramidobacter sp. YE332]